MTGRGPLARRALGAVALCLALSGCFESVPLSQAAVRGLTAVSGPAQVAVLDGAVTISGPAGYCVDSEATRESDIEAFVLLVRCRVTLRSAPVLSATVTGVPAPASDDPDTLRGLTTFLSTAPGRAQLSRTGDPRDVTVHQATYADNAIWMLIEDTGNPASFDQTYWRAILPIAGRIVTLSVLSAREHPVEAQSALAILRGFVMRMRVVNPG